MPRQLPADFPPGIHASPFQPARWLRNAHAQTVFARFHRDTPPAIHRERRELLLADGDHLLLDWHEPANSCAQAPLTLIIHGLGGSSDSHYVRGLQRQLAERGWPSVAMNCRGAVQPNRRARAYHAGASDDVIAVFQHLLIEQRRAVAIVGYSLGGSMTLKALAELGAHPRLLAGVAVSVPLHMASCAQRMDRGLSRLYRRYLLGEMQQLWQNKARHLRQLGDHQSALRIQQCLDQQPFGSFWDFDDVLMAPLHGYRDVHDYYERCTPRQFLPAIRVPTLVIHASDDPFMLPSVVPAAASLSGSVHLELAARGGHVGFISGHARQPQYYLEARIPYFLQQVSTHSTVV